MKIGGANRAKGRVKPSARIRFPDRSRTTPNNSLKRSTNSILRDKMLAVDPKSTQTQGGWPNPSATGAQAAVRPRKLRRSRLKSDGLRPKTQIAEQPRQSRLAQDAQPNPRSQASSNAKALSREPDNAGQRIPDWMNRDPWPRPRAASHDTFRLARRQDQAADRRWSPTGVLANRSFYASAFGPCVDARS